MKQVKTLQDLEKLVGKGKGLWFLSYYEAMSFLDCYRAKDIAEVLRDGVKPMKDRWQEILVNLGPSADEEDEWEETLLLTTEDGEEVWGQWPSVARIKELKKVIGW